MMEAERRLQQANAIHAAVYAAALVEGLRRFADAANTTIAAAHENRDWFASAHEAAATIALDAADVWESHDGEVPEDWSPWKP